MEKRRNLITEPKGSSNINNYRNEEELAKMPRMSRS